MSVRSESLLGWASAVAIACASLAAGTGCEKSKTESKTQAKQTAPKKSTEHKPIEPAPDKSVPAPTSVPTPTKGMRGEAELSQTARPASASGDDEGSVSPTAGAPSLGAPLQGLNLASQSRGLLTGDMKFEQRGQEKPEAGADGGATPAAKAVDESMVPAKKRTERHKTCQKLLDCTKEAIKLAPGSVTSYSVTRESVDSLDESEAAAECASDLEDLRGILAHEKHAVPKVCK